MYLVDTNIWLELLLLQERATEVRRFLQSVDADQLTMTEFALNSIGLITSKLRKEEVFEAFISDILEEYPGLEKDDIYACLLFASKTLEAASFVPLKAEAS